ncbi:MAG: MauE/DoxX family redox-associated membrane protein [Janthinobacterium lividum]
MPTLVIPFLAACALLVVAGIAKLRTPAGTSQALRTQGFPSGSVLVRALGAVELAVAGAALAGVPAANWLVAAAYAGFTAFGLTALLRGRPSAPAVVSGQATCP